MSPDYSCLISTYVQNNASRKYSNQIINQNTVLIEKNTLIKNKSSCVLPTSWSVETNLQNYYYTYVQKFKTFLISILNFV